MKSIYQDKKFAEYWNKRAGDKGEAYKRYLLDPLMFDLIGNLKNKAIIELGCGNGYLCHEFLKQDPLKLILMDISPYNIEHAKQKCDNDKRVEFLQHDATTPWPIKTNTVNVVYSVLVLNEMDDIKTPIDETFRVLKQNGVFIVSVLHPSFDLFQFAKEQAGIKSKKFDSDFEVAHYQRPLSDYFNQFVLSGFAVKQLLEPPLSEELIKNNPGFLEYKDHPIGLIFMCVKE